MIVAVPALTPVTVTTPFAIATVATAVSDDFTVNPVGSVAAVPPASVAVVVYVEYPATDLVVVTVIDVKKD